MQPEVITPSLKIEVKKSNIQNAGRGVFAKKLIKKGEEIEICPALVVSPDDYPLLKKTILQNYYFMWENDTCSISLGFGSIYNHSYSPNSTYKKDIKKQAIIFTAITDIEKGDEITVNYNYGDPNNKKPLWIKDIKN